MINIHHSASYSGWRLLLATLCLTCLWGVSTGARAETASTFTVNSTLDAADTNLGDGRCAVSIGLRGVCTLRAAVQEANARAEADTIVLSAQTYPLAILGFDLDANANTGDLDLTDPAGVTIQGNGAIITSHYRTFYIHADASATLNRLTIRNSPQGIFNEGSLTMSQSQISGNERVQATQPRYAVSAIDSTGVMRLTDLRVSSQIAGGESQIAIHGNHASNATTLLTNITVRDEQRIAIDIGRSIEITANDKNGDAHGFEAVGTLTIPAPFFCP